MPHPSLDFHKIRCYLRVNTPACLAEKAVITIESLDLEAVVGQKNAGDRSPAVPEQPAGDHHAEGLEGRYPQSLREARQKCKTLG